MIDAFGGSRSGPGWFSNPGSDFRPSTYWFWHRQPTRPEIERQLADIHEGGFRTVLIQARMAYPRQSYLDDGYMAAYALAVGEARRLGLEIGIYDEYSWMSGQAVGLTVAGHDHLRERHLFWASAVGGSASVTGIRSPFIEGLGQAGMQWIFDGGEVAWQDWRIVAATATRGTGSAVEMRIVTDRARIVDAGRGSCLVEIDGADDAGWNTTVFLSARSATSRMINYLLPEAAARFTAVVHDRYRQALGDDFAAVKYMFFDHPYNGFYVWNELAGAVGCSILYDETFAARLTGELGMDIAAALSTLVEDTGPATAGIRARVFEIYHGQLHESFFGELRRWCDRHGVGLAGHELLAHVGGWGLNDGFGKIDSRTTLGFDYFDVERYRTHTTVDASNFAPQVSAKFGDSVARAHGRSRCIIEQYATGRGRGASSAAGQWDLTLDTTRKQATRHQLFGARQILAHAFYQTDGWPDDPSPYSNPRFDFAPGVNFEPWYPFHRAFAEENARLSAFLEATPLRPVALFYPLETLRVGGGGHPSAAEFGAWARFLCEAGCGFDIVDESMLAEAGIEDGRLVLPSGSYETVILPAVEIFRNAATVDLLDDMVAQGGRLVVSGLPPRLCRQDGALEDADIAARSMAWFADPGRAAAPIRLAAADPALAVTLARGQKGPIAVAEDAMPLWQWAGSDGESWRLAVFNDAPHRRAISLCAPASGDFEIVRLHPEDGRATRFELDWVDVQGRATAPVELDCNEILCLVFTRDAEAFAGGGLTEKARETDDAPDQVIELDTGWTLRLGTDAVERPVEVVRGWEGQGYPDTVGVGIYRRDVLLTDPRDSLWRLELPCVHTAAELFLNGQSIGRRGWAPYRFAIPAEALVEGPNRLEIHVFSTAGNRYYAGTPYQSGLEPCGLGAPPLLSRTRLKETSGR